METVIKQTIHYMMVSRIDLGLARSLGRVKMCSGSRCTLILWLFILWHCGRNGNNDQTDYPLHEGVTHWPGPRVISRQAQNVEWLPLYTDFVLIYFWHCGQNGNNDQTYHSLHEGFTHWPGPKKGQNISYQEIGVQHELLYTFSLPRHQAGP